MPEYTFLSYCGVCGIKTDHRREELPHPPYLIEVCCNDWGHCAECRQLMHSASAGAHCVSEEDTELERAEPDDWVCTDCIHRAQPTEKRAL